MVLNKHFITVLIFLFLQLVLTQAAHAQIVSNGNFSSGTTSWACGAETNAESVYGGPTANAVAEVDAAAGLCQTLSGLTIGNYYLISFSASRRTGGCPSPATTNVDLTVSGGALSTTVVRTNTTFGYTTSSYLFLASSTSHVLNFAAGTGFGGSTCGMIIDNISVTFSPLPIELLNFDGIFKNNAVVLDWSTATEKNNACFEIERSSNGIDFEKIISLPSKALNGNSDSKLNYSNKDPEPLPGTSYYRLKQIDYDHSFSYSKVIAISSGSEIIRSELYPNPNSGEFTISTSANGSVKISLINSLGKTVHSQSQIMSGVSGLISVDPGKNILPGIYQCVVSSENYTHNFQVIIK